jgi:hypothetical protein
MFILLLLIITSEIFLYFECGELNVQKIKKVENKSYEYRSLL